MNLKKEYWEQYLLIGILWVVDAVLFIPRFLLSPIYAVLKVFPYLLVLIELPLALLHLLTLIPIYIFAPIARSLRIVSPVLLVLALPFLIVGEFAAFIGPRDERFMGMSTRDKRQAFDAFRGYPRKEKF